MNRLPTAKIWSSRVNLCRGSTRIPRDNCLLVCNQLVWRNCRSPPIHRAKQNVSVKSASTKMEANEMCILHHFLGFEICGWKMSRISPTPSSKFLSTTEVTHQSGLKPHMFSDTRNCSWLLHKMTINRFQACERYHPVLVNHSISASKPPDPPFPS